MVQAIAAKDVTLRELKQNFGLQISQNPTFFTEWLDSFTPLREEEHHLLDRVKANFLIKKLGLADGPALDAAIKEVCEAMGSANRNKYRALFYAALVKKFGKESVYMK